MGWTSTGGPKGLGSATSTPSTVADFDKMIELIAQQGNYRGPVTEAERDAIAGDALYEGLMVYNTTAGTIEVFGGSGWDVVYVDSGWQSLTLANSWLNFGGGYASARYRKVNGIVYIQGTIKSGTVAPGTLLATLPAGFRPSAHIVAPAFQAATSALSVEVLSTGGLVIGAVAFNNTRTDINVSFPVDA